MARKFVLIPKQAATGIVTSGLIFHVDAGNPSSYPGSGTTWTDLVGGDNGTLENSVGYDSGNGGALTFDGTNQYVLGDTSVNAGQDFTVEVWFRDDAIFNRGGLVANAYDYGGSGNDGFWLFAWSAQGVAFSLGMDQTGFVQSSIRTGSGNWYQWVATCAGGGTSFQFFLNGVDNTGSITTWGSPITIDYSSFNNYVIGSLRGDSDFFTGEIPIVRIYNRVLSSSEVTQNLNANRGRYGI